MVDRLPDKDKEITISENGNDVIIDDGNKGDGSVFYQNWDQIKELKTKEGEVCIPEYYPAEFKFEQFTFTKIKEALFTVIYSFRGKDDKLLYINQNKTNSTGSRTTYINDKERYIETDKGKAILYTDKTQSKVSIAISDNSVISITTIGYKLSDEEYKKIIEGIKI